MSQTTLIAETGRPTGSRAANRLRRAERVPGVVYGHGMTPVAISVDRRDLRHALSGPAGVNAVVQLSVDGTTQPTVVKDLQRHPVRRTVTHVDFIVVRMNEAIVVDVPIELEGEARQVLMVDGIVEHAMTSIAVNTTPATIPNSIIVDISDLEPGQVIRVSDLELPAGITTDVDPDAAVVVAATTAATEAEGLGAEAAEGEGEGEGAGEAGAEASE
jgi:large subunit ribosomal protein L25